MLHSVAPSFDGPGIFEASLAEKDPLLATAIEKESVRQRDEIELIASEGYVSRGCWIWTHLIDFDQV